MAGFARIPIIEQQVRTPTTSAPRGGLPPHSDTGATALSDVAESAGHLTQVLALQAEHKQVLDQEQARQTWQQAHERIATEAQQMPGEQQGQYVQDKLSDISAQMINDPGNAHIKPFLESTLPHALNMAVFHATTAGAVQTAKDQDELASTLSAGLARDAAADYRPDFSNGPIAEGAIARAYKLIDAKWSNSPQMAAAKKQIFDEKMLETRAQFIARNQPAALGQYLDKHTLDLTPEQHSALLSAATTAINEPMRQIDANRNALRAQLNQKFEQQSASGSLDMGALHAAAASKSITPEDFQRFAKVPFAEPSDPGAVAAARSLLDDAHTPEALDELRVAIASNPNIKGKDTVALVGALGLKKANLNTAVERANAQAAAIIHSSYEMGGFDKQFYDKFAPIPISQLEKEAKDELKINTIGVSDPKEILKAAREAAKAHGIDPGVLNVGKKPAPASPPPNLTPDQKLKIAADLRSRGILR